MSKELIDEIQSYLNPLFETIYELKNNQITKEYITIQQVEMIYSISKSLQAKLRSNKEIPYFRPAGAKVVLYSIKEMDAWFEEWRAA